MQSVDVAVLSLLLRDSGWSLFCSPHRLRGARLLLLLYKYNACIARDGERWPRQPPPPIRIIIINVLAHPRRLSAELREKVAPLEMPPGAVCTSLPSAVPQSVDQNREVGEAATVLSVTQTMNVGRLKPVLFLWKPHLLHNPIPLR